MNIEIMIAEKFGLPIDPLAGVPDEHLDEAGRTVALWSEAGRADLRQLASMMRGGAIVPDWKRTVMAKTLARLALSSQGRHRQTALVALAAVDPAFDPLAI